MLTATTPADVARRAAEAFAPSTIQRIGAEVEWLVFRRDDPRASVSAARTMRVAAGPLPAGGTVSVEPGGQLELATRPAAGPTSLIDAIDTDTAVLVHRFAAHDLALVPLGLDPLRPAVRSLDAPRYEAMEAHFAVTSPPGIEMMNRTAALQLNVDFGADPAALWRLASLIAPVLTTVFAHSPTDDAITFGRASQRQQIWNATDPPRTAPVDTHTADWHRYVLDAPAMLRHDGGRIVPAHDPRRFEQWLVSDDPPSGDDLDLHLTTLFPPLRPRGFLELRMIDALPRPGRNAAIGTVWAALTCREIEDDVASICLALSDPWRRSIEHGTGDAEALTVARALLEVVIAQLSTDAPQTAEECDRWRDRITSPPAPSIETLLAPEPQSLGGDR